jgi:hypothetical protein
MIRHAEEGVLEVDDVSFDVDRQNLLPPLPAAFYGGRQKPEFRTAAVLRLVALPNDVLPGGKYGSVNGSANSAFRSSSASDSIVRACAP